MGYRTLQDQIQKFDSVIAHFTEDPKRRTGDMPDLQGKNMIEPDGRMCGFVMFGTFQDGADMQGIFSRDVYGVKYAELTRKAMEAREKIMAEWSLALPFLTGELIDHDMYWTETGLSELGQEFHDIIRELLTLGILPDDDKFSTDMKQALRITKGKNLPEYVLEYARGYLTSRRARS